jgi:malate/lactate dehydrogenase
MYTEIAQALSDNSCRSAYTLVLANPPNTNCLICCHYAKGIPKENFTALSRLDHNRAISTLAFKTDSKISDISRVVVWGNHSETIYPDIRNAIIKGKRVSELVSNEWI